MGGRFAVRIKRLRELWVQYESKEFTPAERQARLDAKESYARELLTCFPGQFKTPRGGVDFFLFSPSIGAGWLPIFTRLCESVQFELDQSPDLDARFAWIQVKEKFGELRCYWRIAGRQLRAIADIRPAPSASLLAPNPRGDLKRIIGDLVSTSEAEASRTCERCGARPASLYQFGWKTTLCREHFRERKAIDHDDRMDYVRERRKHLKLLREHIRQISSERRDSLAKLHDWPSEKPLTREALGRLVPIREHEGCKYVRLAEIPQPSRAEFERAMSGSTCPVIPGYGPHDCVFATDWQVWLAGYTPGAPELGRRRP